MQKLKEIFLNLGEWIKTNTVLFMLIVIALVITILAIYLVKLGKNLKDKPKPKRKKLRVMLPILTLLSATFLFAASGTSKAYASNSVALTIELNDGYNKPFHVKDKDVLRLDFRPDGPYAKIDGIWINNVKQDLGNLTSQRNDYLKITTNSNIGSEFWVSSIDDNGPNVYLADINNLIFTFEYINEPSNLMGKIGTNTVYNFPNFGGISEDGLIFEFTIIDGDITRPAINGNEHFASNVDNPTPVESMVAEFRAIDDIDGDISHKIVIEKDNFTANKNTLGKYDVDLSVTDTAGNKTTFKFWVTVADITAPNASADLTPKVISYDKTLDLNALKSSITYSDNYYSKEELTVTMTKDTYTSNKTKIGNYVVEYTVSDPSLNQTVISFPVHVKDLVAPVINGITDLTKSYQNIMPLSEILKGITASDAMDGDLTDKIVVIEDTYTGNANRPGDYKVVIQVADNSGNKASKEIKIKVIDDKIASWYITNNVTLNLPTDTPMTRAQIIDLLTRAGQVQASALARVIYSADTYSGNENNPGIYTLAFKVQEPNGNENNYTYAINVFAADGEDVDVIPEQPSFIDKTKDFIITNKWTIIIVTASIIGVIALVGKVKDEVKKNKRRK